MPRDRQVDISHFVTTGSARRIAHHLAEMNPKRSAADRRGELALAAVIVAAVFCWWCLV